MDIHITYETLFDLLRKERSLEELQPLDTSFWNHVVTYLQERKEFFERTSSVEQEKTRFQLQNIKRIVKEIYERRERKIISLALNVNKTENTTFFDTKHMLPEEKLLFHETVKMLSKYKHNILTQVCNYQLPTMGELTKDIPSDIKEKSKAVKKEKEEQTIVATPTPSTNPTTITEEGRAQETTDDEELVDSGMTIEFTSSVPKFLGKEKEIYGPYEAGMTAELPPLIANILLKKGKAKIVGE